MDNEEYFNDALSRYAIDELVKIWYDSTVSRKGEEVRRRINEHLPDLARRYGLKNYTDFRSLVEAYDEKMYKQGCSGTPETCLLHYTRIGDLRNVKIALKKGASNLNVAMGEAAEQGDRKLVDLFISKGARNWKRGLYCAAKGGHEDLVLYFIKRGADNFDAAYRTAQVNGHTHIMEIVRKLTPVERVDRKAITYKG